MNFEDQKYALFRVRNVSRDLALAGEIDAEVPAAQPFAPKEFVRIEVPKAVALPSPFEGDPAEQQVLERAHWMTRTLLRLALLISLLTVSTTWYLDLRARVASSAEEVQALEQKRASLLQLRQKAEPRKVEAESLLGQRNLLGLDRNAHRWSRSLQTIILKAGPEVELLDIQALGQADETGLAFLRIDGRATSGTPRATAENFRRLLEADLKTDFLPSAVKAGFVTLDEESDSFSRKALFTLNVRGVARRPTVPKGGTP